MAMLNDSRGPTPKIKKGKIVDMIADWTSKTAEPFISFEYFPPKTDEGVAKLHTSSTRWRSRNRSSWTSHGVQVARRRM